MAQVVYSPTAVANLERAFASLSRLDQDAAFAAVQAITTAVDMLAQHPFIGRIVREELRELVISFGRTGYLALYRFLPALDAVRILAVRHQRELDYPGD